MHEAAYPAWRRTMFSGGGSSLDLVRGAGHLPGGALLGPSRRQRGCQRGGGEGDVREGHSKMESGPVPGALRGKQQAQLRTLCGTQVLGAYPALLTYGARHR